MPIDARITLFIRCYRKIAVVHAMTPVLIFTFVYTSINTASVGHLTFRSLSYTAMLYLCTKNTFRQPDSTLWTALEIKLYAVNIGVIQCVSVYPISFALISVGDKGLGIAAIGFYSGLFFSLAVASLGLSRFMTLRPLLIGEVKERRVLAKKRAMRNYR
jgi:hypothetical protein